MNTKNHILHFKDINLNNLASAGGKASHLGELTQAGLPVPPGFVLTVEFFEPWIALLQETDAWKGFIKSPLTNTQAHCKAIQSACSTFKLSPAQQNQLQSATNILLNTHFHDQHSATNTLLNTHFNNQPSDIPAMFAVRSSSPEEDLDGTSFAGGYETVLGVTPLTLENAIIHSFTSAFDERIVIYKLQNNMAVTHPRIAIVVQVQIASQTSGVAFSLNPQTNCYDEAVINANFGLGETVVSGTVTPDTYIVNKLTRQIITKKIANKEQSLWLTPDGGTTLTANAVSTAQALSDEQILQVANLASQVEARYNKPMDIEWAFVGNRLYLLQGRPITAYLPLFPEMVTQPGETKHLYMDFIVMTQGFVEPMSVLGLDIWANMVFRGNGMPRGKDGLLWDINGRHYLHLSHALAVSKMMFNAFTNADKPTKTLFEQLDLHEYTPKSKPAKLRGVLWHMVTRSVSMLGLSSLKGLFWSNAALQDCKDASARVWEFLQQDLRASNANFETQVNQALDGFAMLLQAVGGLVAALWAKKRIEHLFRHHPEATDLIIDLSMNLPGNPTAEMGNLMVELASFPEIQNTPDAQTFLNKQNNGEFSAEFAERYQEYCTKYGCRGQREIDIASPRNADNPACMFEQIKRINPDSNALQGAKDRRQASYTKLRALASKLGKEQKFVRLARIHHEMMGYREHPKYMYVVAVGILRTKALALGATFVEQGRLHNVEDIFSLTISQITRAEQDPHLELLPLVAKNTKGYKPVEHVKEWPRIIDSRGKILRSKPPITPGALVGEPIAPGVVTGRAKVLSSPDEQPLNPGEILVCRASEPSWAPVFINAAAVVMEIGGPLQHGAIIAREYGLPCVSSVEDATKIIKDGDMIQVDGSNGTVQLVS